MEFLASDALNGRASGSRDEWIAAAYMAAQMRRLRLDPLGDGADYMQTISIERIEMAAPPALSFAGTRFIHGKEILVQGLGAATVTGPLQGWKPGIIPQPGAFVLMPDQMPTAVDLPPSHSAAAVLVPETPQTRARWAASGARLPRVPPRVGDARSPTASSVVLDRAAHAALRQLPEGSTLTLHGESKPPVRSRTWNAAGKLRGSDPAVSAQVILLSAHFDHVGNQSDRPGATGDQIFNGADDDASGCVAVLELMEALARGPRLRRTIVFAWFGSEESGGFGSRYFADKPVVPLVNLVANLQFEMLGRPDPKVPPRTLWLTGYERSTLGPELARHGARLVQDPHPTENFFMRSDNIQFARRGVVAHTVSSYGLHKEYHTPDDEIHLIDFVHMTDAIRSMLEPIRWLANADFVPAWLPGKKP